VIKTDSVIQTVGDAALRAATMGLSGLPVIVGFFYPNSRSLLRYTLTSGDNVPLDEARRRNGVFWCWPSDIRRELRVGQVFTPKL
jgi:hypothetical protein